MGIERRGAAVRRGLAVGLTVVAFMGVGAAPALAAPPGNDIARRAIPVTLPTTLRQDTTEATTDAQDAVVNTYCGAPATDASVWFTYTPAADGVVIIDVSRSDYTAGVIVTTGGALGLVGCGPGTVLAELTAGVTYYVLAFDDQGDGGGNGGNLVISFVDGGGSPVVSLAVNPNGRVDAAGNAIIRGTYTCENAGRIQIAGELLQLRAVAVRGSFEVVESDTCDGTRRTWQAVVEPVGAPPGFTADKALVTSFGFTCGRFLCAEGYSERVVRLRTR